MAHDRRTVLVTGGAGFIGSALVRELVNAGDYVVVFDNLSLGSKENLPDDEAVTFHAVDLADARDLEQVWRDYSFDMVYHLAANSDISQSHDEPSIDLQNTFMTTYNVLDMMKQFGCKRIFFSSTSAIYGEPSEKLTENSGPLQPISHYGACKLASEAIMSSFAENYEIKCWIARFPNVVGERLSHGVIYDFVKKLRKTPDRLTVLGNGSQVKPYLHVRDLVSAIVQLTRVEHSASPCDCYNIGTSTQTSVSTIAAKVVSAMNPEAEIVYTGGDRGWIGDVPTFAYDTSKIEALGWTATMTSDEAIDAAIQWMIRATQTGD